MVMERIPLSKAASKERQEEPQKAPAGTVQKQNLRWEICTPHSKKMLEKGPQHFLAYTLVLWRSDILREVLQNNFQPNPKILSSPLTIWATTLIIKMDPGNWL
jgi:hypothetical protein